MLEKLNPLYTILNLNAKLFINTLSGIDESAFQKRIDKNTNSMSFISCHMLDARYYLCGYLGYEFINPFQEIFNRATNINEIKDFPPKDEITAAWKMVSEHLSEKFSLVDNVLLSEKSVQKFPVIDNSVLWGIAFLLQLESYHIGQLSLLRKHLGYDAMKYD